LILGTSLIVLPVDIAEMLNAQIGAKKSWNGQYLVECSKVPDLPDLSFYFGGKAYPLKGSDYVLEVQGTCISSFTPMNLPGGLWIIGTSPLEHVNLTMTNRMVTGDVFLRRYYTVYDLGRNAVGFAKSA
jgi:saccharopepsin